MPEKPDMPRIGDKLLFVALHARRMPTLIAVWVMLSVAEPLAGAQVSVDANTAASLPQPEPTAARATPIPIPAAITQAKPPLERAQAAPSTQPASEERALGKPNAALSARPIADPKSTSTNSEGEKPASGLLNSIDPRRNDFTRVLGALAAVVGLILLTRTLVVRYMPSLMGGKPDRPSGVIEVLARYPIGRGQQLLVLKFARRILLVHQAGATSRTLTEMTDPDEVAATLSRLEAGASAKSAGKFKAALQSFENEHDSVQARRSRSGAALAATETEIIDLTRTQIRSIGGFPSARRVLR